MSTEQRAVQGKINFPLVAHRMNELGMWVQEWAKQVAGGFPVIGIFSEPRAFPEQPCADPELTPSPVTSKFETSVRRDGPTRRAVAGRCIETGPTKSKKS